MKKILAAIVVFFVTNHAQAGTFISPPYGSGPIVIVNDGGGIVDRYESAARQYSLQHRRVEIRGSCRSACTLALSVADVCVGPGAVLKWHHAYDPTTGEVRAEVTREMMDLTPSKIRRVVEPNIDVNYNSGATLTYRDLVRLGIPDCDAVPSTFASTAPSKSVAAAADAQSLAYAPTWLTPTKPATQPRKRPQRAPAKNVVENFFGNLFR